MKDFFLKNDKFKAIFFYTLLTVILTWPVLINFLSSVPSNGSDTMQVIGTAGIQANELLDHGIFRGTFNLLKSANFNLLTLYAYFQLIFGRILGYNLLFYLSFILSGFGVYLLADHFVKNKKAAFIAGVIYAFSPFHVHNALSTNVGTMHQEWLPFFALYLFKFFEKFEFRKFLGVAVFLFLIGFTEHQLLAFTAIFVVFFIVYKLIVEPKKFLDKKLGIYFLVAAVFFSVVFFFIFRNLLTIANSDNNFLDAGLKSAVRYSNDSLSIFVTPPSHSFWPGAFQNFREQVGRKASSTFSIYAGYSVLLLSLLGIIFWKYLKKREQTIRGIFFWLAVALGFYILSWGPYFHFKGVLNPPVKMPYYLIYQYLPYYKNIRTVGRLFAYSMLAFSLLAAWGTNFLQIYLQKKVQSSKFKIQNLGKKRLFLLLFYSFVGLVVILEFLAVPFRMDSLEHSSFYEKLGQNKENFNVLEIPGSTSYIFASRDLVWKSIHRKNTINGYDFARVNKEAYTFQQGTPIIRTLLYDIPAGNDQQSDKDIMATAYYKIANQILNYYNIRYIILDHEALKESLNQGGLDEFYTARAYIRNIVSCVSEYEDNYLYACEVDARETPNDMFFTVDYSNSGWIARSDSKSGLQRWASSGASLKLMNMSPIDQSGKINLSAKVKKPLNLQIILNGKLIYQQYLTKVSGKTDILTDTLKNIKPGENNIVFEVRGADGAEIHSDKKSDAVVIYNVDIN